MEYSDPFQIEFEEDEKERGIEKEVVSYKNQIPQIFRNIYPQLTIEQY